MDESSASAHIIIPVRARARSSNNLPPPERGPLWVRGRGARSGCCDPSAAVCDPFLPTDKRIVWSWKRMYCAIQVHCGRGRWFKMSIALSKEISKTYSKYLLDISRTFNAFNWAIQPHEYLFTHFALPVKDPSKRRGAMTIAIWGIFDITLENIFCPCERESPALMNEPWDFDLWYQQTPEKKIPFSLSENIALYLLINNDCIL